MCRSKQPREVSRSGTLIPFVCFSSAADVTVDCMKVDILRRSHLPMLWWASNTDCRIQFSWVETNTFNAGHCYQHFSGLQTHKCLKKVYIRVNYRIFLFCFSLLCLGFPLSCYEIWAVVAVWQVRIQCYLNLFIRMASTASSTLLNAGLFFRHQRILHSISFRDVFPCQRFKRCFLCSWILGVNYNPIFIGVKEIHLYKTENPVIRLNEVCVSMCVLFLFFFSFYQL